MKLDYNLRNWEKLLLPPSKDKAGKDHKREKDKSKSFPDVMSTGNALQRMMAPARSNASKAQELVVPEPESTPSPNKRPRLESPSAEAELSGELISISVPVSSSLAKNPTPILTQVRKLLLLPEDEKIMRTAKSRDLIEERLTIALKLFQHQVYQEIEYEEQQNQLNNCMNTIQELGLRNAELGLRIETSEKAASDCKKKIKELEKDAYDSNKKINELETEVNQLKRLKRREQELISEVENMKLELANKEKQIQELADNACLRVTGPLMRKFLQGKITKAFAHRSVSDWETYLNYLGEPIPEDDS